jgi:hypothetical protein
MLWFPHTQNIYKVFENILMLWMGRWIRHHAIITILVGLEFFVPKSWVAAGLHK